MYGAHIMVHTPPHLEKPLVQLKHVEVRKAGQAFRLGRYPIHFHILHDMKQ